ncbi:hypothetical protein M407DRAFT_245333 [Tulasnella calospora MUT 4182]|uniref:Secreted protein n=1 Tax=Tulasnella calospora MUT 4182 TaxID=1051891 RepID=A0A0C3QBW9_9AGAM|nr:hypothetical protein M407DRAFT_245333 [Tulasnella calospora MUT 4182]
MIVMVVVVVLAATCCPDGQPKRSARLDHQGHAMDKVRGVLQNGGGFEEEGEGLACEGTGCVLCSDRNLADQCFVL